jgi:hypothetical protein
MIGSGDAMGAVDRMPVRLPESHFLLIQGCLTISLLNAYFE